MPEKKKKNSKMGPKSYDNRTQKTGKVPNEEYSSSIVCDSCGEEYACDCQSSGSLSKAKKSK
ncbi:MAG: hypothetical protein FWE36_07855 [Erysipelotrichales bacterium]|nr:hypothetical protein [Erysipelotrichales bacterium]